MAKYGFWPGYKKRHLTELPEHLGYSRNSGPIRGIRQKQDLILESTHIICLVRAKLLVCLRLCLLVLKDVKLCTDGSSGAFTNDPTKSRCSFSNKILYIPTA